MAAGSPASLPETAAGFSSSLISASSGIENGLPALVEGSEDVVEQLADAASAGRQNLGSPLSTVSDGAKGVLQDGFGRCSPGRWHPSACGLTLITEEAASCKSLSAVVDKLVAIIRVRGLRPHVILLPWAWCLDLGTNEMFFVSFSFSSFSGAGVWSFSYKVVRRGPGAHVTLVRELFAGLL